MVVWVAGVQREAEEWSHPAQDMRKMNGERERGELWMQCLQGDWA